MLWIVAGQAAIPMTDFCRRRSTSPLDQAFTTRIPEAMEPQVGARVLVPFRQQSIGRAIVTELHNRKPAVQTKNVI